jgi:hypothetical protein
MPPPAAALLFALPPEDAPAAAEPSFFSLDMLPLAELPPEVLPLAAGALELDDLSVEVDALPDVLLPELALELSAGFCSVVVLPEALPLADGVDVDGVDALPDVLPLALVSAGFCSVVVLLEALPLADGVDVLELSELGFCSWLVVAPELEPDCSFLSCATALSDSNAAATATAIGLKLI